MDNGLPAPNRMWLGGFSVGLLVVAGIFAIAGSIPGSRASMPDAGPSSAIDAAARGPADESDAGPQRRTLVASKATRAPTWPRCAECGVIESVRQVEGIDGPVERTSVTVATRTGASGAEPDRADGAVHYARKVYEVTIRFRDGRTMIVETTAERTWRLGSQVNVIAGMDEADAERKR